jgi:hypothetical protein
MKRAGDQDHQAVLDLMGLLHCRRLAKVEPQARRHLIRLAIEKGNRVAEEDRMKMSASDRKSGVTANWPKSMAGSRNKDEYRELENIFESQERKLDDHLNLIDKEFNAAKTRDPLLHVTPEVCSLLRRISKYALLRVRHEELVLFPREEDRIPGEPVELQHWFTRRRSASLVCELAGAGNAKAYELLSRLLEQGVDWPIRQMVVGEVCGLIATLTGNGTLSADDPSFRQLAKKVVDSVFTFPEEAGRWAPPEKEELDRVILNVQAAAEKALARELPKYPQKIRDHVVKELVQQCEVASDKVGARLCKPALQRLLSGLDRTKFTTLLREEADEGSGPRGPRPSGRAPPGGKGGMRR